MKKVLKLFTSGLLFLAPVGLSIYVIYWIFDAIANAMEKMFPGVNWWVNVGLGIALSLAVILIVGLLMSFFITRPLLRLIERVFGQVPLIKILYSSIKDLISAFVGDKKTFDRPVTIDLDGKLKAIGFITQDSLDFLGLQDQIAVYLPDSYNFSGNLVVVNKEDVTPIKADSSDVMTFIVSGGVSGPNKKA